ncbi:hypothetical protein [Afipia clevelandensis]|uniref:Uncharacterized protein n=1 Tax=Afipia clevelandensis ATCC 49720 TaxID=883079 RepID=K8PAM5_9BRAD|nr:hypothetical protein [Afipia clevelandensis]EKS37799.1 hypothetical protein HMPREF9696_01749 [Afipia clevelandensis ATCC 49720]
MSTSKIFLCVDRDGWTGGYQLSIDDDHGGFRIAGPKYNGSSKSIIRHQITARDAGRIREYLDKIAPAVAETDADAQRDDGGGEPETH